MSNPKPGTYIISSTADPQQYLSHDIQTNYVGTWKADDVTAQRWKVEGIDNNPQHFHLRNAGSQQYLFSDGQTVTMSPSSVEWNIFSPEQNTINRIMLPPNVFEQKPSFDVQFTAASDGPSANLVLISLPLKDDRKVRWYLSRVL